MTMIDREMIYLFKKNTIIRSADIKFLLASKSVVVVVATFQFTFMNP